MRILTYIIAALFITLTWAQQATTQAPQVAGAVEKKQIEEARTADKVKTSFDSINLQLNKLIKKPATRKQTPKKKLATIITRTRVVYRDTCFEHVVTLPAPPLISDTLLIEDSLDVLPPPKKRSWIHNIFKKKKD